MASELDIPLGQGSYALAAVLDGRESAVLPCYWTTEGGPITRVRPVIVGPLLVVNLSPWTMSLQVGYSDDFQALAMWMEGDGLSDTAELTLDAHKAEVLSPVKTYIGLKVSGGSGVLRSVGVLPKGPSAMPAQPPQLIVLG